MQIRTYDPSAWLNCKLNIQFLKQALLVILPRWAELTIIFLIFNDFPFSPLNTANSVDFLLQLKLLCWLIPGRGTDCLPLRQDIGWEINTLPVMFNRVAFCYFSTEGLNTFHTSSFYSIQFGENCACFYKMILECRPTPPRTQVIKEVLKKINAI